MSTQLIEIERELLEAILSTTHMRSALRSQIDTVTVVSRRYTGVGFYSELAVAPDSEAIDPPNLELGRELYVDIENVPQGAGAVLFVRNGFLSMLELFTFSDPLPSEPRIT